MSHHFIKLYKQQLKLFQTLSLSRVRFIFDFVAIPTFEMAHESQTFRAECEYSENIQKDCNKIFMIQTHQRGEFWNDGGDEKKIQIKMKSRKTCQTFPIVSLTFFYYSLESGRSVEQQAIHGCSQVRHKNRNFEDDDARRRMNNSHNAKVFIFSFSFYNTFIVSHIVGERIGTVKDFTSRKIGFSIIAMLSHIC